MLCLGFFCLLVVVVPLEIFSSMIMLEGKNSCSWGSRASLVECCQAVLFHLLSLWPFRVSFYTCLSVYQVAWAPINFSWKIAGGKYYMTKVSFFCRNNLTFKHFQYQLRNKKIYNRDWSTILHNFSENVPGFSILLTVIICGTRT